MSPGDRARSDAMLLRDRLKREDRDFDAGVIQRLIISSASSAGLNKVLAQEVRELTARVRQAELEQV